jgi:hypothetical protein
MLDQVGPGVLLLALRDVEIQLLLDLSSDGLRREELDGKTVAKGTANEG